VSLSELQFPGSPQDGINVMPGSHDDGWVMPRSVVLNDTTHVQLFKDGEALHAAFEAIRRAKKRVGLEVYIFHSDATGKAFADLLCKKAAEGVEVFLIYDSFGCNNSDHKMFRTMSRAGIRMAEFHPIFPWKCRYSWRLFNRDHRKLLIIDDHMAGLGGLNIGDEYGGSWIAKNTNRPLRDNAVGIRGNSAKKLVQAFAKSWNYATRAGKIRNMEMLHNLDDGEFGVLATVPTRKSPAQTLRHLMRGAQNSILMTMPYFAPPDNLIDALCGAARRNVRVRLMLPGTSDHPILLTAARSFYERLLSSGVEIHERQGCFLHAKTTCIDSQITVMGSTNLDYRSIEYNCELSMILRNGEFGRQIHDLFENDVLYSKKIELGRWKRRPMLDRFIQWGVSRIRRLL
jgi:cardiolipin synthase A/B